MSETPRDEPEEIRADKLKWEELQGTAVTSVYRPTWLANLLNVVWTYNFPKGFVFFCVTCERGVYQDKHFQKDAQHCGHWRLQMYEYESSICVNRKEIEDLAVDTAQVQEFTWSVPETTSTLFIFTHNTFGYASEAVSPTNNKCLHCQAKLGFGSGSVEGEAFEIKFCCLDCKFQRVKDLKWKDHIQFGSLKPGRLRELLNLPPYSQQVTRNSNSKTNGGKQESPNQILANDQHSGSSNGPSDASAEEHSSCIALHESDVKAAHDEDDASSQHYINTKEKLKQWHLDEPWESKRLVQKALAAASGPDNWRHQKTTAVTKSDWGVNEQAKEVEMERPGLMAKVGAKFVDDHVLAQATSLLHAIGSEFKNNYSIRLDQDSSSADRRKALNASVASPGKESFKVGGSKDFISLKQLLSTFDPQSWVSDALCPQVWPLKLPPAEAPVP